MASLHDILGAILRDAALARAETDRFVRSLGDEYRNDDLLRAFPVPRPEIRELSIDLALAFKAAAPSPVDPRKAVASAVARTIPAFLAGAAALAALRPHARAARASDPVRDELSRLTEAELLRVASAGAAAAATVAEAFVSSFPDKAARSLRPLGLTLRDPELSDFRAAARDFAVASVAALAAEQSRAFNLEVAVTPQELSGLPDSALTRVRLTLAMENYEWVARDEGGPQRLIPR